jgi:hypothetical protein
MHPSAQVIVLDEYSQLPFVQVPVAESLRRWVASAHAFAGGWVQVMPAQGSPTQASFAQPSRQGSSVAV